MVTAISLPSLTTLYTFRIISEDAQAPLSVCGVIQKGRSLLFYSHFLFGSVGALASSEPDAGVASCPIITEKRPGRLDNVGSQYGGIRCNECKMRLKCVLNFVTIMLKIG